MADTGAAAQLQRPIAQFTVLKELIMSFHRHQRTVVNMRQVALYLQRYQNVLPVIPDYFM